MPILQSMNPCASQAPIGVFDSGIGGLSVLRALQAELPHERFVYLADTGHAPYGERGDAFVAGRALAIAGWLRARHGIKALVVACNTATAAAIARLRACFSIPIVGIEPALKPAVAATRSGVVGILATGNTVRSDKFAALLDQHGQRARVIVQPCPGLADCVERGDLHGPRCQMLLARYLQPLLAEGVDTLVLGCTHYPFLIPAIQRLAGPTVAILDPSPAVARQLRRRLESVKRIHKAADTLDDRIGELDQMYAEVGRQIRELGTLNDGIRAALEPVERREVPLAA